MKQYKLIKWYPSLPKNWEKGMIVGLGDRCIPSSFSPCSGKYEDYYILYEEVVNNPEFWEEIVKLPVGTKVLDTFSNENKYIYVKQENGKWTLGTQDYFNIDKKSIGENKRFKLIEEVIEKDYEILAFLSKRTFNPEVVIKHSNGKFAIKCCNEGLEYESYYKSDMFNIYSVKRLSDGEIFTIGDKIDSTISDLGRSTDLTGFKIIDGKLIVGLKHLGFYPLSTILLPKKPLFTTEDGVDIFEGDVSFGVNSSFKLSEVKHIDKLYVYSGVKEFSTKEKAEQYILMNKPCLSINDVISISYNPVETKTSTVKKLIKLVKSKL